MPMANCQNTNIEELMDGSKINIDTSSCFICHRTQEAIDYIIRTIKETEIARIKCLKEKMISPDAMEIDDLKAQTAMKEISRLAKNNDIFLKTLVGRNMDYILVNEKALDEKIPGLLAITDFYRRVLRSDSSSTLSEVLFKLEHGDYSRDLKGAHKKHEAEIQYFNEKISKMDDYLQAMKLSNQFKQKIIAIKSFIY